MRKLTVEDINEKVRARFGKEVSIDWKKSGDYKHNKQKVWAKHVLHGYYCLELNKLLVGTKHPALSLLTREEINSKVLEVYEGLVHVNWDKTPSTKVKDYAFAVDKDYGEWRLKISELLRGAKHKQRYYDSKKTSPEVVNVRVQSLFNGEVSIDWEKTGPYKNTKQKVVAKDVTYGEYTLKLIKLLSGQLHPQRSRNKVATEKMLSLKTVNSRIKKIHKNHVTINWEKSGVYSGIQQDVYAIDSEFGEWVTKISRLLDGRGHRQRGIESHRYTQSEIDDRIKEIFSGNVFVNWEKSGRTSTDNKVFAVDSEFGEWEVRLGHLLRGSKHPNHSANSSAGERELSSWLKSLGLAVEDRKMMVNEQKKRWELDAYIPEHKLGVEYHGLYWHSDAMKEPDFHVNKRMLSEDLGLAVIQVFENEWHNQRPIVESIIKSYLGLNNKIESKGLRFKKVESSAAQKFLVKNHIKGKCNKLKFFGLFLKSDIVSLIGIRELKNNSLEIVRFTDKNNLVVENSFSLFIKNINSIYPNAENVYYAADLRYEAQKTLLNEDFALESVNTDWNWTDGEKIFPKEYFKADPDNEIPERNQAVELGLYRIYDAGQAKFVKKLS